MSDHTRKTSYRPEIDGLRAIAVVAVILFHAKVPGFSGGYVGVDVFFVISGFLITGIIVRQLQQGTFSLVRFWERRIRRIVPVLMVVLLTTAAAGYWLILFPLDYLDFGQSMIAQALFLSNIFFLRKSDYFAGPSEDSPLLHTWSLAIEEQFYFGFPILLMLLWKFGRRFVVPVFVALFVGSLAWCQYLMMNGDAFFSLPFLPPLWASADNTTAAFYLLPTRAFELLIGALLALAAVQITKSSLANFAAGLGLSLVLGSIFLYSDATFFPGFAALLPTVGTALLILAHTGRSTIIKTTLTNSTLVWVGLLSYSLYLWHWPVLVLGKYWLNTEVLSGVQTFGLLTLTLILSIGSYYLVEKPVRGYQPDAPMWKVYFAGIAAIWILFGIGYYIISTNGLPERAPAAATTLALGATDFGPYWNPCFVHSFELTWDPCRFGPKEVPATHLVLGDSHGGAILPGLAKAADQSNTSIGTYISAGCSPLHPVTFSDPDSRCATVYNLALDHMKEEIVTDVLLVSRWTNYRGALSSSADEAEKRFEANVSKTLDILSDAGVNVTVLLQVPHHEYFDPREAFYEAARTNTLPPYSLPRAQHDELQTFVNSVWQKEAEAGRVTIIDPTDMLCDANACDFIRDGVVLYTDSNHLNATGAQYVEPVFTEWLTIDNRAVE